MGAAAEPQTMGAGRSKPSQFGRLWAEPSGRIGIIFVGLILFSAIFAPWIAPHDPNEINVINRLGDPTGEHWVGTDSLGRDNLSRLIHGARIALGVALPTVLFGAGVGLVLGLVAGYFPGKVDNALLVMFDIIRSFPTLLFAIAIITFTGSGLLVLVIVLGVTRFPEYARLIRAQTMKAREEEYVTASRAIGCSTPRVLFKHLFPNVIPPLFILAAMDIPVVVMLEAGISFLGLGVPPPAPSWGTLLREGYLYARVSPWILVSSGLALTIATLGFTYLAEALRDTFDVRLRGVL